MFSSLPDVLTVEEVATVLSVCPGRVYRLLRSKKLGHFMIGKFYRIPRVELIAFVRGGGVSL